MPTRRAFTVRLTLGFLMAGGFAAGAAACDDDASSGGPTVDAGSTLDVAARDATPTPANDSGVLDANRPVDSGTSDTGTPLGYTTCKTLKDANPSLPSGVYDVDLDDDAGVYPKLSVYCDMTFAGGGWTLLESFNGAATTSSLGGGPADAGYLAALPRPGTVGALAGWVARELAAKSSQVHIRYSFEADAGAADPDAGVWITSRAPGAAEVTVPMQNLRNLDTMSKGTDGGFPDWTGPQANATKLSWVPNGYDCFNLTNSRKYPDVLWSCGNFESLNIISERVSFRWNDGTQQPLEVYVR